VRERCCDELTEEGELLCGVPTLILKFHNALQSFWLIDCIRVKSKNECFGELLHFQHQYQLALMMQTDKVFNSILK
jgi:hypothetical protein